MGDERGGASRRSFGSRVCHLVGHRGVDLVTDPAEHWQRAQRNGFCHAREVERQQVGAIATAAHHGDHVDVGLPERVQRSYQIGLGRDALHSGVAQQHFERVTACRQLMGEVGVGCAAVGRHEPDPQRHQRQRHSGVAPQQTRFGQLGEDPLPVGSQHAQGEVWVDAAHDELHLPAAGVVLHFGADPHLDAVVERQTACCGEVAVHQALAPLEQRHPHAGAPAIIARTRLDEVEVDVAARRHRVADDLAAHPDLTGEGLLDRVADCGRQVRDRPRAVGLACRVPGRCPDAFDSAAHGSEAVTNSSASRPNYATPAGLRAKRSAVQASIGCAAEGCQSGRMGRSRKPLWPSGHRGFESHTFRHTPAAAERRAAAP